MSSHFTAPHLRTMTSDQYAQLTLAGYLAAAALLAVHDRFASGLSWSAWFLYAVQRAYAGLMYRWRANRKCPFPRVGPALILANHRSPVDPMMVWANHHLRPEGACPPRVIGFLMAREYYEKPGLRWLCRSVESIPTDRDGRDIGPAKEALSRLKQGRLVGVFPEGRLNRGEGLLPFGQGVAWLALKANVPVYPVYIDGAPQAADMVTPFVRPCRVRVVYGDPIDLSPWRGRKDDRAALAEVTELLRNRLLDLSRARATT